jgi:hypothetical protein
MKSDSGNQAAGDRRKILFVKYGSFSHVNAKVERVLRERFSGYDLEVVDRCGSVLRPP